jgi:hypothetical protein
VAASRADGERFALARRSGRRHAGGFHGGILYVHGAAVCGRGSGDSDVRVGGGSGVTAAARPRPGPGSDAGPGQPRGRSPP